MNDPPQFEVGDLVRLKRDWTALEVVHATHNHVIACYGPDMARQYRRWKETGKDGNGLNCKKGRHEDFVPWDTSVPAPCGQTYKNHFKNQTRHVLKDEPPEETSDMAKQQTLYTWIHTSSDLEGNLTTTEKFGHHIGTMPDGRWVMAPANGGDPVVGQASEFTEVVPYSILIENLSDKGQRPLHVWATKEMNLQVGQVLVWTTGDLVRVKKIDTKSKEACQWVEGMVLEGRIIPPPE